VRMCVSGACTARSKASGVFALFLCGEAVFVSATSYAFDWIFHNKYCGFLFRCNCTWNWDGGWDGCNVHNPHGPRCPWCGAGNPPTPGFTATNSTLSQWQIFIDDNFIVSLMVIGWAISFFVQSRNSDLKHNLFFNKSLHCSSRTKYDAAPVQDEIVESGFRPGKSSKLPLSQRPRTPDSLAKRGFVKRMLFFGSRATIVPYAIFTIYNFFCALVFYAASSYPYFLWFNSTQSCGGIDFPC